MLLDALRKTLSQIADPRFRGVLLRAVGFTLLLYVGLGWAAWQGIEALAGMVTTGWLHSLIAVALGLGAALLAVWLAVPIAALFVGLFLDDVAEAVERRFYPPPGKALSLLGGLLVALRFLLLVVGVNLLLLPVYLLLHGPNALIFLAVNAYLLGREFFEMVGARQAPLDAVRALRRRRAGTVFLAGLMIAVPLSVPVLNLVVPILGTAFMVHVYRALAGPQPPPVVAPPAV